MKTPPLTPNELDVERLKALYVLLGQDSPEYFQAVLMDLFESWMTSYINDGAVVAERARIWFCFRSLYDFFEQVKPCDFFERTKPVV